MTSTADRLVESYLDAVRRATADLPADRRDDLLADLTEHIATARAELDPETEAGVQEILDRLGDPDGIAAEARVGAPEASSAGVPGVAAPDGPRPTGRVAPVGRGFRTVLVVLGSVLAALVLLCVLGAVLTFAAHSSTSPSRPATAVPVPAVTSSAGG